MRESVDSTTAIFMRFSKRRRKTEPNHPLGLRICAAMKCLSVTISPLRHQQRFFTENTVNLAAARRDVASLGRSISESRPCGRQSGNYRTRAYLLSPIHVEYPPSAQPKRPISAHMGIASPPRYSIFDSALYRIHAAEWLFP